jgi:hypothetical protein
MPTAESAIRPTQIKWEEPEAGHRTRNREGKRYQ